MIIGKAAFPRLQPPPEWWRHHNRRRRPRINPIKGLGAESGSEYHWGFIKLLNYHYNGTLGTSRQAGGLGRQREAIPTPATVPGIQTAAGLTAGAPGGRENRRGRTRRGIPGAGGGIDDSNIFPRLQPPPDGGGVVSRDDRVTSTHQGVDPGQWACGGGGLGRMSMN